MARKTPTRGQEATTGVANDPDSRTVRLKKLGGSQSDHWNTSLANQAARAMWVTNSDAAERDRQRSITAAALVGIAPTDVLEGMMAAQLLAAHNAAMECYRRAMLGEQTVEGRRENLNQATKLSRTWATLLDALNRHRGKGQRWFRGSGCCPTPSWNGCPAWRISPYGRQPAKPRSGPLAPFGQPIAATRDEAVENVIEADLVGQLSPRAMDETQATTLAPWDRLGPGGRAVIDADREAR